MPPGDLNNSYLLHPLMVLAALLCLFIFIVTLIWGWQSHRLYAYTAGREMAKLSTTIQTAKMPELTGQNIVVKHYPGDEQQAQLVLGAAEKFMQPVSDMLDYQHDKRLTIVVYPTREKLNRYFGWPADESAMGVYWAGTIRVLAPREWINEEDPQEFEQIFYETGPVAHEIAHLVVDYRTRGNYSRWFTEGIAQYVELELTGFMFNDSVGSLENQRYTLQQLTNQFETLSNQSLAYRQSLAAIYYLIEKYGQESLLQVMDELAKGQKLEKAFIEVYGIDFKMFEYQLNNWINKNWKLFN